MSHTRPTSYRKKNLLGCGLTKVENHWAKQLCISAGFADMRHGLVFLKLHSRFYVCRTGFKKIYLGSGHDWAS
jgi:hypothetical protein